MTPAAVRTVVRSLLLTVAGLALVLSGAPPASAATTVDPFAQVDATTAGCDGVVVTAITPSVGVRYLLDGAPLTFPTALLPFDRSGRVELTAAALPGYVLSPNNVWQQQAPAECVTDLIPDSGPFIGNERTLSWCSSDPAPELKVYAIPATVPYTGGISWQLVNDAGAVVAAGEPGQDGDYPVVAPVPRGLPLGRYDLELRNTASDPSLFPLSIRVYQYECVTARRHRGVVVFTNPSTLDARVLIRWGTPPADGSYTDPDAMLTLPAGTSRRFRLHSRRPQQRQLRWEAYPLEPGQRMGSGTISLPRRHPWRP